MLLWSLVVIALREMFSCETDCIMKLDFPMQSSDTQTTARPFALDEEAAHEFL